MNRRTTWQGDGLTVETGFPGGNLLVDDLADGVLRVRHDQRDSMDPWFHWSFRLRGAAGRRIAVRFGDGALIGVRGPALSLDEGRSWRWLDDDAGERREAFSYEVPAAAASVRFAFGIPHQLADWEAFTAGQPGLRHETLCTSRGGRAVPLVRCGDGPLLLMVTARHHCCEAMAGYAVEGLVRSVLADPAWRGLAELLVVPFVDLDGSEEGDQGKGRLPRDHGRDYLGDSVYPETAAIRRGWDGWAGGRRVVQLDLHCPWIAGEYNQHIYQVGAEDAPTWAGQQRLAAALERVRRGPLPYRADGDLPFGRAWNTGANYGSGCGIRRWASELPGTALATTFEIPYADAAGVAVLPEGARAFGADLARALREVLAV